MGLVVQGVGEDAPPESEVESAVERVFLRNLRGEGNPMPCLEIGEMSTWYSPTGATGYTDFPVDAQV